MADRTKRIFISDIHMGDEQSNPGQYPYVWFRDNAPLLAQFLGKQLIDPTVEEVVILGDLFDQWIVPANFDPVTRFKSICLNGTNGPVITELIALAKNRKLVYVPGNHDMALDAAGIDDIKKFLGSEEGFPGIRFICDDHVPLGKSECEYKDWKLVAEHGNRYCLFNSPDTWTNPGKSFLPLGYFISRLVAFKELTTGTDQNLIDIIIKFLGDHNHPKFIERMMDAIATDCQFKGDTFNLRNLPGYESLMTADDVGMFFSDLKSKWKVPGAEKIGADLAIMNDQGDLNEAADKTYLYPGSETKVVIFGHTHYPCMWKGDFDIDDKSDNAPDPEQTPCPVIYANSGTWVDKSRNGCTYVETEEAGDRLYVRVKAYTKDSDEVMGDYEGFVEI